MLKYHQKSFEILFTLMRKLYCIIYWANTLNLFERIIIFVHTFKIFLEESSILCNIIYVISSRLQDNEPYICTVMNTRISKINLSLNDVKRYLKSFNNFISYNGHQFHSIRLQKSIYHNNTRVWYTQQICNSVKNYLVHVWHDIDYLLLHHQF